MLSGPKPIPFITEDPRRPSHFIVDPAAAALLKAIKGPICPVVVAGPYRSGKSTLLNFLLPPASASARRAGFAVGSSVQACTKGIWLWGAPIKQDGKTLLLLDSEGLGSIGKEATFDVQIFSLSILLASLFVLNTSGTINEGALEQLELVVQMTERVRAKDNRAGSSSGSNGGTSKEDNLHALAAHFPDFLWVLRDFSLELQDASGSPISARQYLEQALQPVAGARSAEKNRIRHVLSTVFPSRECVPLVRPVTDEKQLQRMQTLELKDLRAEFRTEMDALRERVRRQVRPKMVEGTTVTGSAYLSLAEAYVQAINGGTVPVIHSAWTAVVELQAKKALEEAHASFHADVKQLSASLHSAAELTRALEAATAKAQQLLSDNAVGDVEHVDRLRKELSKWVSDESERVRELNTSKSRQHNAQVWAEVWKRAKGDSVVEEADDEAAWAELEAKVRSEYNRQARGEGIDEVCTEALAGRRQRMMARVMQRRAEERKQLSELQRTLAAREKRVAELERQVAKLEQEVEGEKRARGEERRRVEEAAKRSEEDKRRAERELNELREQLKELQGEGKNTAKELNERQRRTATLEAELRASELEVRRVKEEAKEAAAERKRAEGGSREKQAELDSLHSELNTRKKEYGALSEQYEREKKASDNLRTELNKAQREQTASSDRQRRDEGELQQEREKRRKLEAEVKRMRDEELSPVEEELQRLKKHRRDALDRERLAEQQISKLAAGLKELSEQRAKLEAEATQGREWRESLRQVNVELAEYKDEVKQLNAELEQQTSRVKELEQQAEERTRELERTNEARARLQAELQETKQRALEVGFELDDRVHSEEKRAEARSKKRKIEEREEEKDEDMEDATHHISPPASPHSSASSSSFMPLPPRPSMAVGRRSLAPTRLSDGKVNDSTEPADPNALSVQELKSWLTELDVELPVKALKKDEYVEKVYAAIPELLETYPRKTPAAKKAKKGR